MIMDLKVKELMNHVHNNYKVVILSYGMGVESTGILLRWILDPETCPVPLDKLIVITSQVGNEWKDSGEDVDKYIIPLLRKYQIRFVQVARHGHTEADGITVLEDSRNPSKCYLEGDYTLSTELLDSGTVPQFGGLHKCALKFKNYVIEKWLNDHIREPAKHAFGYSIDEQSRVNKSETGFMEKFKEYVAFGFNTQELSRVKRAQQYDTPNRIGYYPLLEWGWNRQDCIDYIYKHLGVLWKKSACTFCPFSHNKQSVNDLIERQFKHPVQVADAMMMEKISLSMNIRGHLYSNGSLIDMVKLTKNESALAEFQSQLNKSKWALYHVRRIFKPNGMADRCVEKLSEYSIKESAELALMKNKGEFVEQWGINYLFQQKKIIVPGKEEFKVVAPALVDTKARYGVKKFNDKWNELELIEIA